MDAKRTWHFYNQRSASMAFIQLILVSLSAFRGCYSEKVLLQQEVSAVIADIAVGPINNASLVGDAVIFNCEATDIDSRIQWTEYATGEENGQQISDNEYVSPVHPNASRYEILYDGAYSYDLYIASTVYGDGGRYECEDTSGPHASAQLVMLESDPVCTTTIPADGSVVDQRYYTIECTVDYRAESSSMAPIMTWTGPGSFDVETSTTDTTVWSRVGFRATSAMTGEQFSCKTNFTKDGFDDQTDSATNAPSYQYVYHSVVMTVTSSPYKGVTYIRWGRSVCESTADTVYKGYAAGSGYFTGGSSDHLCLPETAQWGNIYTTYSPYSSQLHGVQYWLDPAGTPFSFENNGGVSIDAWRVPCVVCLTDRPTHLMIPMQMECPVGWTREYYGYLTSEDRDKAYRTSYICVDEAPEAYPGAGSNTIYQNNLTVVEAYCPYIGASGYQPDPCVNFAELSCVICTK